MSVINKLASSIDRKDQVPNQELANEIVKKADKTAIVELVQNLTNKNKTIQNDCIKVLYEIGEQNPGLISGYLNDFIGLLTHKNNRLQWGAMIALNCITPVEPKSIYNNLTQIMNAAEKGSVITRDNTVHLLINLARVPNYFETAFSLLIEQLLNCAINQLPMYAERISPIVNEQ
jgi:HEAT repeat protein